MCCSQNINSIIQYLLFVAVLLVVARWVKRLTIRRLKFIFKTSFIENLIRHRKFTKNPRKIYYIYPKELEIPPVKVSINFCYRLYQNSIQWDHLFPHIDVEFVADLPTYAQFWAEIKRDSLVVIDDLWSAASNNEHVSNCFKVYSKKYKFSIAIVTQVW